MDVFNLVSDLLTRNVYVNKNYDRPTSMIISVVTISILSITTTLSRNIFRERSNVSIQCVKGELSVDIVSFVCNSVGEMITV